MAEENVPEIYKQLRDMLYKLDKEITELESKKKEMEKQSAWFKITCKFKKDYDSLIKNYREKYNIMHILVCFLYKNTDLFKKCDVWIENIRKYGWSL